MNSISNYLPIDRRLALAKSEAMPTVATGAVLLADVSGFTPLTVAYAEALGPRQGVEEIIRQINGVYTALIGEVHRYGGSVIYFSGDALTCWFDADNGLRATACALAMQDRMLAFAAIITPLQETVPLSIKVAIAAGPVRRFSLGNPAIMLLEALVGSTLNRMATAEKLASAREIVVSEEVVRSDPQGFIVSEWRIDAVVQQRYAVITGLNGSVTLTPWSPQEMETELAVEVVRPWLLPPVFERLQNGTDQFLSELRPVVAMFLKFDGLEYDHDDDVGGKLDAFIRWVQQIASRYEGFLLQLTTGDKGSYLYLAFGALISHENDADRALMAAEALRQPPESLHFIQSLQIGISKGQMRVGPYGSQIRRVYGAFGHETNMAARLMSYATPGQVIVSSRAVESLTRKANFLLQQMESLSLKGSTRPMVAYKMEGIREALADQTAVSRTHSLEPGAQANRYTLFGRQPEQVQLLSHLEALQMGRSGVVIIEGEAGIGKSSIVHNLMIEAREVGITALLGEADAIEHASPYFAWRAIFYHLLRLDTAPAQAQERQAYVLQQLPVDAGLHNLAPLLNAVISFDLPENELTREMSGLSRANKTHELLTAVLQQATDLSPLLIILEDAHWLDSSSWALAEAVSQQVAPLLLVLVSRPLNTDATMGRSNGQQESPAETASLSPLLTAPRTHHISLKPLSGSDSLKLVCQRLGVGALPPPIATFITQRAEGHPLFSEELAYALRDAQVIEVANGFCRLKVDPADIGKLDFPTTIEGVVTSRIDRLTPAQQLVLKVSSVIGRVFSFYTLRDIHPVGHERPYLTAYLEDLHRLDITLPEDPEPALSYIFKHIITQQVSYNLLLYSQRRELHRKVAEWYETVHPEVVEEIYPLLAYHWYRALDITRPEPAVAARAIYYAEKAGDQAIHKYANQEAIRFFAEAREIALHLADNSLVSRQRQAHWELQLGEAYTGLGQLNEGKHHFGQCLQLLGWPLVHTNGRMVSSIIAQLISRKLPKRTFLRAPEQRIALQEAARAYEMLGQIFYLTNQTLPTLYAMIRGLNLAEQIGVGTPELARAYANMSGAVALVPLHHQSRKYEARAWTTVYEMNNITTLAYVAFITSVHKINIAAWEEGLTGFQKGLELATQLGDRRTAGFCISGLAHMAYYQGYLQRSLEMFKQLEALGEAAQDVTHWGTALGALGAINMRWGQWAEAKSYLEKGLPLVVSAGNALAEWNTRVRLGLLQFWLNDHSEAVQSGTAAYAYSTKAPHSSFANTTIYADLLTLLLLLQQAMPAQVPDAPVQVKTLLKRYRQYTRIFPFALPTYWRLRGWAEWINGRSSAAFQSWHEALAEGKRLDVPYEIGMAHKEIGCHLPPDDPQRAYHLNQAVTILTALEATFDRDQAAQPIISTGG